MGLQNPPFDAAEDVSADWLELRAFSQSPLYFSDITRIWELNRSSEDEDFEGKESTFEEDWLQPALLVVERRGRYLGTSYPFSISPEGNALIFSESEDIGAVVYLFCLMLSTSQSSELLESGTHSIDNNLRDLFQACAAWAASGAISGSSYATGWPRPDGNSFIEALRTIYHDLMCDEEAVVHDRIPPALGAQIKDGGIDVVAWRSRPDRAPGKFYLIGQVASGANWKDKSVISDCETLKHWFSRPPCSTAYVSMFIPFSIIPNKDATFGEQMSVLTTKYGMMFYRDVLPHYAQQGYQLSQMTDCHVHRCGDLDAIKHSVAAFKQQL